MTHLAGWDLRPSEVGGLPDPPGCLPFDLVGLTQLSPHKVLSIFSDASGNSVLWKRWGQSLIIHAEGQCRTSKSR